MIRKEVDGIWVTLRETIAIHHEEVFACLTTSGGLSRWFPVDAEIDLRQGGTIKMCWDRECTKTTTVAILDFDEGGKIVWDWHADYNDTHAPVYWSVEPGIDGTKVVLRQGPFRNDEESLLALAEEAESWRWQLCNLRSVLEVKHDMRAVRPI